MSTLTEFFLGSNRTSVKLETLVISHVSFSKIYYIVRNARKGITIAGNFYEYVPVQITDLGSHDDLDAGITVTFGDLGQILPKEIDRVLKDDTFLVKPIVNYSAYDSNNLTAPIFGPYTFEVSSLTRNPSGATFDAKAPGLNFSKTGELYRIDRFPMLRGFL